MSARPAALERALEPFVTAGLRITVRDSYLLLHDVPVVDSQQRLQLGTLISTLIYTDTQVTPPATHQVWFDGPFPCFSGGGAMEQLRCSDVPGGMVGPGVPAQFYFSNKPDGWTGYQTHFDQLMHYWRIITDQARVLDPNCTRPVGCGSASVAPTSGPFKYPDACSARGRFSMASDRLSKIRVAIVGLGGTGAYVLDQVAKTPVREIHLFDGDTFELHNAFRAPGAADESDFSAPKVAYYAQKYGAMHTGIVPHQAYVTAVNIALLSQFDFVFVCVDDGPARREICTYLIERRIPFIDCGMDLSMSAAHQIFGTCRVTLATPANNQHFFERAPTMPEAGDALYEANIQIADANALNAQLAVMRWKQHFGFYAMDWDWHHFEFAISSAGLAKAESPKVSNES
jgi:ThiF family